MAQIKIVQTADGSDTLYSEQYNAHYHSLNGAIQESLHIFIKNGYESLLLNELSILEVGFGTGLNAALTATKAIDRKCLTVYTGVDSFPLDDIIFSRINYNTMLSKDESETWKKIISAPWGEDYRVNNFFILSKLHADFCSLELLPNQYDIIYFDAFAPEDQPEIWTIDIFKKLYNASRKDGILVTYCSKGIVKQALREVGYKVERLAGPPGKRHMIRAIKT